MPEKGGGTKEGSPQGAFKWHSIIESKDLTKSNLSLWHAKAEHCSQIMVDPTHFGTEHNPKIATKIQQEVTDLFIQRNMRWTSQMALTARTPTQVLGSSSWLGLSHDDEIVKFAFTVWSNSIFGFLTYWHQGQRQNEGRSRMQVGDLCRFIVPDFAEYTMLERARLVHHKANIEELFRLPLEEAKFCRTDNNRQKFNQLAAQLLGIPKNERDSLIADMQRDWTAETSVTGKKRTDS